MKGASGQVVTLQKSTIVFSRNVEQADQATFASFLGVQKADSHNRYLGLSTWMGRNKT